MERNVSPYQFSLFRIMLGIYLVLHFSMLLPYAAELWSNQGILPSAKLNLTYGLFPNVLYWLDAPWFTVGFVALLCFLSLLLILGYQRPIVSLLLWYGWVCLFNRNNLISNPGIPFVGWILLALAVIPKGEPLCFRGEKDPDWKFPPLLFWGAWALMAIGYSISGIDKWQAPSWRNGDAIPFLLDNPLARDWFLREWFLLLPDWTLHLMTWSVLAVEILFLPFSVSRKTRPFAWLAMIWVHLGILLLVDFADLTWGMLMIHLFTFDATWLKPKQQPSVAYFDGVCGVCNAFIDFLVTENQDPHMKFAPLQGSTAAERLTIEDPEDLRTIMFQKEGKTFTKSRAVIEILAASGGIWAMAPVLRVFPSFLCNAVYDLLAKNRYRLAGKKEECRIPTPQERARFLP